MSVSLHFKTREELSRELNISTKTLSRRLQKIDIDLPARKLIAPGVYEEIKRLLINPA
jgi:DNA-binding HxlR family transcriptional regulator